MFNFTDSPKIDGTHWPLAIYYNEYEAALQKLAMAGLLADFANAEDLTADRALTDADWPIQRLTPSGADRAVTFPAPGVGNHPFLLVNAGDTYSLILPGDFPAIEPGKNALAVSDASAWHVVSGSGGGGTVATDGTLTGDGSQDSPLSVASPSLWEEYSGDSEIIRPVSGKTIDPSIVPDNSMTSPIYAPKEVARVWNNDQIPAGWSWAGSPFVTPEIIGVMNNSSFMWRKLPGGAGRAFLFTDAAPILAEGIVDFLALIAFTAYTNDFFFGVRLDAGNDNNYVEVGLKWSTTTANPTKFSYNHRMGGGSVSSGEFTQLATVLLPPNTWTGISARGTHWSNWDYRGRMVSDGSIMQQVLNSITWTPTRIGFTARHFSSEWDGAIIKASAFI